MTARKTERPTEESRAEERPVRKGGNLYDAQEKLTVAGKDKDFHYVWVNNEGATVARYIQADYVPVEDENLRIAFGATRVSSGTTVEVNVDRKHGLSAILMRKPIDWYEEDKKAQERIVDDSERALHREKDEDGRYGKIDFQTTK